MINLFVDDIREPHSKDWVIARSSYAALSIIESCAEINILSLDHDLGGEDTINSVLTELQRRTVHGLSLPQYIRGHSANPVGMQKINQVIEWINERR